MKLFVGWDVGGWHCDRNRLSRDALAVLDLDDKGDPRLVGRPWRGSLRSLLGARRGEDLVNAMLGLCEATARDGDSVTIAIDAPLGWPAAMLALAGGGPMAQVSEKDGQNPYTRRQTELDLIQRGLAPLSSVRDMIGSQSTKAIHFLRAANLEPKPGAIWSKTGSIEVSVMETYPAVALKSATCRRVHDPLLGEALRRKPIAGAGLDDVRDALACAVVAYIATQCPEEIRQPPLDHPPLEGWIILPKEAALVMPG